jgi:hypothetical protein
MLATGLLAGVALLGAGGSAAADDASASPSPGASGSTGPTDAGTSFRTATALQQGQQATADASTGDYLYWVFSAASGQSATVTAEVRLPDSAARRGSATWRLDVFDGLRRRQACASGKPTRTVAAQDAAVPLSCTLRTVRAWTEPWANDPLPGAYYVRLTAVDLPATDLGQPVHVQLTATAEDAGGSKAVDGELAAPLTPVSRAGATLDPNADPSASLTDGATPEASASPQSAALAGPDGGWGSGWWSDRWIWTVAGGVLGALAGVAGYTLAGGPRRRAERP